MQLRTVRPLREGTVLSARGKRHVAVVSPANPSKIARRLGCDVPDVDTASPVYDSLQQWIDHAPD